MAVSTLEAHQQDFKQLMAAGLKRSTLEGFVENVGLSTEIAMRNLNRAAELVTSFKQVAADQTSSQRRNFNLKQVIEEILITMRPTLSRSTHRVETFLIDNLVLDPALDAKGRARGEKIRRASQRLARLMDDYLSAERLASADQDQRMQVADAQRQQAQRQEQEAKRVNDANQAAILRLMNELQTVAEGDLTQTATVTEERQARYLTRWPTDD